MTETKPVGLILTDEDYDRLKAYAADRKWSMALAARDIVVRELDREEKLNAVREEEKRRGLHD